MTAAKVTYMNDPARQRVRDRAHVQGPMKSMGGMLRRCDHCSFPLFPRAAFLWKHTRMGKPAEHVYLCTYCHGQALERAKQTAGRLDGGGD